MKKTAIAMLIVVALVLGISFILNLTQSKSPPPEVTKAQYLVHAGQRYYYTNRYTEGTDLYGRWLTLHGYWDTVDGKNWEIHNQNLKLSASAYPNLTISSRP